MCCNCCNNTLSLGCFNPCGIEFITGATVPIGMAGTWTLFVKFGRRNRKFEQTLIEGQAINFLVGCLSANYEFTAWIIKPDGTQAVFEKSDFYDCFTFTTKVDGIDGINALTTSVN